MPNPLNTLSPADIRSLRPTGDPFQRIAATRVQQVTPAAAAVRAHRESVDHARPALPDATAVVTRQKEYGEPASPRARQVAGNWDNRNTVIHVTTFLPFKDVLPLALTSRGIRAILYADPPTTAMLSTEWIGEPGKDGSEDDSDEGLGQREYQKRAAEVMRLGRTPISIDAWFAAGSLIENGPAQLMDAVCSAVLPGEGGEPADPIQLILERGRVLEEAAGALAVMGLEVSFTDAFENLVRWTGRAVQDMLRIRFEEHAAHPHSPVLEAIVTSLRTAREADERIQQVSAVSAGIRCVVFALYADRDLDTRIRDARIALALPVLVSAGPALQSRAVSGTAHAMLVTAETEQLSRAYETLEALRPQLAADDASSVAMLDIVSLQLRLAAPNEADAAALARRFMNAVWRDDSLVVQIAVKLRSDFPLQSHFERVVEQMPVKARQHLRAKLDAALDDWAEDGQGGLFSQLDRALDRSLPTRAVDYRQAREMLAHTYPAGPLQRSDAKERLGQAQRDLDRCLRLARPLAHAVAGGPHDLADRLDYAMALIDTGDFGNRTHHARDHMLGTFSQSATGLELLQTIPASWFARHGLPQDYVERQLWESDPVDFDLLPIVEGHADAEDIFDRDGSDY